MNAEYSEISVGDVLPEFRRTTDLANWNRYAAVNDEFVPIHMDGDAARAAGQKDVFGMGNLRISYMHNTLRSWLGSRGDIVDFEVEFRGLNFKGDQLSATAVVSGKELRDGHQLVHLTLGVKNQDGKNTAPGKATVQLFDGSPRVMPSPEPRATTGQGKLGRYLEQRCLDRVGETTASQHSLAVGANDIRRWAIACYYPEPPPPNFYDEEPAAQCPWGGLVAPREFNPFAWMTNYRLGDPWLRGMRNEPGYRVLNGGQRNRYFAPLRPGAVVSETSRLADVYEKEGRMGTMLFFVNERRWTNQHGDLLRVGNQTTLYY